MAVPVISLAQMREWEKATWASGQTEAEVIRRVGASVAEAALELTRPGDRILIVAGKGNNGADARAARDHLSGRRPELLEVRDPQADLSKLNGLLATRPALIIDGLFGIGLNRPLDTAWKQFISTINASGLPVLAVDVPSGLNAETGEPEGAAVEAAVTLCVGAPKKGMLLPGAWRFVGRLQVAAEVGLAPCPLTSELNWMLPGDFRGIPRRRMAASHKGSFGHLAIVAGSLGYHGAAVLAARGAQRAQPGLVTLLAHESVYPPVAAQLQAVMVRPWPRLPELPGHFSAMLIGPGLAAANLPGQIRERLRRWWAEAPVPLVVDATALDWLQPGPIPAGAIRVVTPHPGEAARLLGVTSSEVQARRPEALRKISAKFGGAWVVLKGHQSLIGRAVGDVFVNPSGNPFLAQGGSGDVLSGFLAGLLAQPQWQADPLTAIRLAVWAHGAAADGLSRRRANWVVEDLVEALEIQDGPGG